MIKGDKVWRAGEWWYVYADLDGFAWVYAVADPLRTSWIPLDDEQGTMGELLETLG